jgi:hypothetical protein
LLGGNGYRLVDQSWVNSLYMQMDVRTRS